MWQKHGALRRRFLLIYADSLRTRRSAQRQKGHVPLEIMTIRSWPGDGRYFGNFFGVVFVRYYDGACRRRRAMFCNACGTELQPTFNVCPKCGKPVGTIASVGNPATYSRLQKHLPTLGILWIAVGVLFLIPSLAILFVGRS